ncbi:secreted RxLR effector protein 161-like [Impatiens glandulifera]|uniref:secreted RxLR effector protein 161-like n=1 Tax=Impatiens glandulifera TaxID=253017 RepID=UPI001FB086DE|nr:secreted RxLR effector protein 161-like [Impatiens glandulifera]
MTDGKKNYTPLDVNPILSQDEETCLLDPRPYRALVGSLIYLTITRPDIAYEVGVVSRYMQVPTKPHLEEAKKILKYINTSLDIGLLYEKDAKFVLQGYADADFAGDLDDRRSTSGLVFLCGNTSISWSSRKQGSISLSTKEAEYKASTHAAHECI